MSFLLFLSFTSVSQNTVITPSVPFLCNCERLNKHKEISKLGHFKAIKKIKSCRDKLARYVQPTCFFCMIQEILSELCKILLSRSDCKSCLREEGIVGFWSDMGTLLRICIKLFKNWNLLSTHVDNSNKTCCFYAQWLTLLATTGGMFGSGAWNQC